MDGFDKYIGRVFDKRYKIEKIIGVGGMAIVFKAEDILMNRTVAIKMLKNEAANDAEALKRFINESKAVAMLSHKNIVSIYDVSVKGNIKYIVMEYIEGITLKTFLKHKGGRLSWRETINITEQILRALEHAHEKGVIHRDIKPQNIMLLKNGLIKVADFGIAKLPDTDTVTADDKAIGTVYYISPEQARNEATVDERSDLYSVGVMMYELSCGELPFTADTPVNVALMQVNEKPKSPKEINSEMPEGLDQIIMRAMEKDPELRFQSAKQMLRHILALKENPAIKFHAPGEAGDQKRKKKTKKSSQKNKKQGKTVRERGGLVMPVILGVVSAFLIVFIILAFLVYDKMWNGMEQIVKTIPIRNYVGIVYDSTLENQIEALGLKITVIEGTASDATRLNEIVQQDPVAGKEIKYIKGEPKPEITLYVYRGSEYIQLPDFSYMNFNNVKTEYAAVYVFEKQPITDEIVPSGHIIKTEPAAGSDVRTGDTIRAYVSKGPSTSRVNVPNVIELNAQIARSILVQNGLEIGNISYLESELPEGIVISQSLPFNTEVATGTAIDLVISTGPGTTEAPETEETTDIPVTYETDEMGNPVTTEPGDTDGGEATEQDDTGDGEITEPPQDVMD